jgi:sugar phosphate isomerase/epimerase
MKADRIGVCSWSLRPSSAADLAERVRACGLRAVQLALDPVRRNEPGWSEAETARRLGDAGISMLSGMMAMAGEDYSTLESIRLTGGVRPDARWAENLAAAGANAALAQRLGLRLVTFHAGFLPEERGDAQRRAMIERLGALRDVFAARGVGVALETGQETASTLAGVLEDLAASCDAEGNATAGSGGARAVGRGGVGVNFDPANMILYGMGDPVEALRRLGPWVRQVHIKDALPATEPGRWGREMPAGRGAVDWPALFAELARATGATCDLVIERESGEGGGDRSRIEDIRTAAGLIERLAPSAGR